MFLFAAAFIRFTLDIHGNLEHLVSGIGGIACGFGQLYNLKLSKTFTS